MMKATPSDYGLIAKLFHWILAVVILWQLFTGINLSTMEFTPQKGQFIWFHQITGTLLFTLIAFRLLWRFYNRPKFLEDMPPSHRWGSKIIHAALYILCLWLPLQGALMTWAGGYDVYLVGLIKIPALVAENRDMYPNFVSYHYQTAIFLLALTTVHIAAGLYHRFVAKDRYGVWNRMAFRFNRREN